MYIREHQHESRLGCSEESVIQAQNQSTGVTSKPSCRPVTCLSSISNVGLWVGIKRRNSAMRKRYNEVKGILVRRPRSRYLYVWTIPLLFRRRGDY